MTESSKEMSDRIRRASGREAKEEVPEEVAEALADISAGLDTLREGVAAVLEGQKATNEKLEKLAGEKAEPGASEEAAS